MPDFFEFKVRPRVLYRQGLVEELGHEIAQWPERRVFVVGDAGVQQRKGERHARGTCLPPGSRAAIETDKRLSNVGKGKKKLLTPGRWSGPAQLFGCYR